ncbi:vomeronasal type-2 receptor 26-like [Rhinoderma darwinii]|uniref:vomeronasal type-2 receptor 26-like n=1 Tax=Rhinoderma darwinii TaxID=43563 RepID=UPI003F6780C8
MWILTEHNEEQRRSSIEGSVQELHRYLGSQKDINGNRLFYENGDFAAQYSIVNWHILKNGSLALIYVGSTNQIQNHSAFNINVEDIVWKNIMNKVPKSQCSENCLPGTRKVLKSRIYSCCYDCVQFSPGEISNLTDSESCMKCTDLDWPNEKKDRCVPRLLEFLSYTDDTIVLVICLVSTIFCLLTFMILMTFILYQDTAIVKANNRYLSFLLLVSIMLSFLCVFLFLGHPVDLTCLLRQVSFGILFSVAVSCVLAKTIMVCIAFKATKPGSAWKRWIGSKWANSLVLFCSSIQVMICMGWLTLAPPFPELDIHSYQGKIIVQCNEGSVIGFYSVLGYMGVLAAVSFITAFLARRLPDSFNEAKYITFSMLVFCSVWIAMIPAYLSTKGKYMVAVEIFAILTSSAGLLGCIFFPKCYIILWRPELNSRIHLLDGRTR